MHGQLINTGAATATGIDITIALYDEGGRLAAVETSASMSSDTGSYDLAPDASIPFRTYSLPINRPPAVPLKVEVYVTAKKRQ